MTAAMADTRWTLQTTTAATDWPISLAEVKAHLRLDDDDDNEATYLRSLIMAATQYAEQFLKRQLITATLTLRLDDFPRGSTDAERTIWLPNPPLQSVTSVVYLDSAGASQTLSSSLYRVDATDEPGRISEAFGQSWPATYPVSAAITVVYVAGWTSEANVPEPIKAAMKLLVSHWFENREPASDADATAAYERLLWPYRAWELG